MNVDFRVSTNLVNHYKTKKLIRLCGYEAFYSLLSLWSYVSLTNVDGSLTGMDELDIALVSNWPNEDHNTFVKALCECRWLDKTEEGYKVHDWEDNNPYAAKAELRKDKARFSRLAHVDKPLYKKLKTAGRTSISKEEYKNLVGLGGGLSTNVNDPLTPSSMLQAPCSMLQTHKEEEEKVEKFKPSSLRPEGVSKELWKEFLENRTSKKLKNSKAGLTRILNKFEKGVEEGYSLVDIIDQYVSTGMQNFKVEWMKDIPRVDQKTTSGTDNPKPRNQREKHNQMTSGFAREILEKKGVKISGNQGAGQGVHGGGSDDPQELEY